MEKTIEIGEIKIRLASNAATPLRYKMQFHTDYFADLMKLAKALETGTEEDFNFDNVSANTQGYGMAEAPRGGLGHWVKIKDGKVENYQAVVPSTWNAAPRDYKGRLGAYESSLIGTKVANPDQPLEILRTVHSFDPCIACAVHIIDTNGKELGVYKVDPIGGTSRA